MTPATVIKTSRMMITIAVAGRTGRDGIDAPRQQTPPTAVGNGRRELGK
jgi:hypothetical protein